MAPHVYNIIYIVPKHMQTIYKTLHAHIGNVLVTENDEKCQKCSKRPFKTPQTRVFLDITRLEIKGFGPDFSGFKS